MARETAAQKRTRIEMLLADYDNRSRELRKLAKIVDGLKEQVREIAPGTYNSFTLSEGTPREILDQPGAKRALVAAGIEVPMKMTEAPIVVKPVGLT
jgi:hypothetical protein